MTGVLCTPLRVEQAALRGAAGGLRVVRTGMGPRRAGACRLPYGEPVLVAGVAGGLAPEVRPGHIVVASEVRGADATVPVPSAPLLAGALRRLGLTVHCGPIVSSDRVATGKTRGALAGTGALAVDMESAVLAASASGPFAVTRSIVDTEDCPLWHPGTPGRALRALTVLRRAAPALRQWATVTGPRQVVLAEPRSFCAGVTRAIDTVRRTLHRHGAPVYVRRQIVHNAHVVHELQDEGAVFVSEVDEVPRGATVVLAAHGVAPAVRRAAAERELTVIDATCPLVTKVHSEVRRYAGHGQTVLLIGHPEHEEVEGTAGEAPEQVIVVDSEQAARTVRPPDPQRVACTVQTTLAVDEVAGIMRILRERFPALHVPHTDDICYATTNRQRAVREVASTVDLLLVVGSANSSNSRRLVEVAERQGTPARLVDDASEVDLAWLAGAHRVGVTAGASAPPHLVEEIVHVLTGLGPVSTQTRTSATEDVAFTLPREVI